MFKLDNIGKLFKQPIKPSQPADNIKPKNRTAEIREINNFNKLGKPIEEIISNDLPGMIDRYIEDRGLESHPKLGLLKMWGGSYAEAAIRNDDANTEAKNLNVIEKEIVYKALDDYCKREKIRMSEAA
jgi:hypothetical protein